MRKPAYLIGVIVPFIAVTTMAFGAQNQLVDNTLQNFQIAFNGESNAHARYMAFATKADQEGYGEVASLFRAAAKAEEIHAKNHAEEIKKLGGTPEAKLETPVVKSTKENLETAITGERYERDLMYPDFRKQAWNLGNREAVKMFNYARNGEGEHAKLFEEAYGNLDSMRGRSRVYYVCIVCGYATKDLEFEKCHSCFSPKEKFEQVS